MSPEERGALADEVAARVVEMLRDDRLLSIGNTPLTVAEVAGMLGRSPDWVRDNRHRLGVLPSEGKRPRLMFDPTKVREAMRAPALSKNLDTPPKPKRRARAHRSTNGGGDGQPLVELLEIKGRAA